ncbi:hypothetical protein BDK51DRAFT_53289 [Blyttiomyces helicus]|uniref:ORC6 second cyclin-like domain-containing protein n=1 Tax=Blyttiomyces helicus TaxID=388810 RepID=A0A4P9WHU8_9FUNG|nr:hypothetical protein BDK51DRAFT_53289 [Blyttiomyces helicus]|eukprot:RKO90690.1 hypothetical protein BDK51DRAFT_53289 [Blyttiomyces helicus]
MFGAASEKSAIDVEDVPLRLAIELPARTLEHAQSLAVRAEAKVTGQLGKRGRAGPAALPYICVQLACERDREPFDPKSAQDAIGLTTPTLRRGYDAALEVVRNVLNIPRPRLTLDELGTFFGYAEAVPDARELLQTYRARVPRTDADDAGFVAAVFYCVCRAHKAAVDKAKLQARGGSHFDGFVKLVEKTCKAELAALKTNITKSRGAAQKKTAARSAALRTQGRKATLPKEEEEEANEDEEEDDDDDLNHQDEETVEEVRGKKGTKKRREPAIASPLSTRKRPLASADAPAASGTPSRKKAKRAPKTAAATRQANEKLVPLTIMFNAMVSLLFGFRRSSNVESIFRLQMPPSELFRPTIDSDPCPHQIDRTPLRSTQEFAKYLVWRREILAKLPPVEGEDSDTDDEPVSPADVARGNGKKSAAKPGR